MLLFNLINNAETPLHSLEYSAKGIGLHFNSNKTEYMTLNQNGTTKKVSDTPFNYVEEFTYRCNKICRRKSDVNAHISKSWGAVNKLSLVWRHGFPDIMKRSLFQATFISILLYGCSAMTLSSKLERRLNGGDTCRLRLALNVTCRDCLTNE